MANHWRDGHFRANRETRTAKPYHFGVTEQDGATALAGTCRLTLNPPLPAALLQRAIEEAAQRVQTQIEASGGIVGHVKCFVDADGAYLQVSCTGFEPQCTASPDWDAVSVARAELRFAAIGYQYDLAAVRAEVKALFERLLTNERI